MGRTQRQRLQRRRRGCTISTTIIGPEYMTALYAYLSQQGWRNETKLTVRNFPITDRGLCSKRELKVGDDLIKLPLKALITIATIEADENFKECFNSDLFCKDIRVSFQSLLALYLLHHKHLASKSYLVPFLNSLPTSFSTPYFCLKSELYCLPEAVLEKTVEQNRKIRSSFENLQTVFGDQNYFKQIFNINAFKWSYFVVNSRCVFVQSNLLKCESKFFEPILSDSPNLALAPFLDLFNHSSDVSTSAELIPRSMADKQLEFVLTLLRAPAISLPRFTQLFISYGALPNLKLLTEYGFILPKNLHDFFEFSLTDIETFIKVEKSFEERVFHRNKFKFIREHNLADQMFVHQNDGVSHNFRVVLHLLFKETSYFPNILNQVAYGDVARFDAVEDILNLLIEFKISEYKVLTAGLIKFSNLSPSGAAVLQYLEESVRFLQEYLLNFPLKTKNF